MQDESRHVAFGRLALRDYYPQLTQKERDEREEFLLEACYLMRDRFDAVEVWKTLGLDPARCAEHMYDSGFMELFRSSLFTRIVPIVTDIGLWGDTIRNGYETMGTQRLRRRRMFRLCRTRTTPSPRTSTPAAITCRASSTAPRRWSRRSDSFTSPNLCSPRVAKRGRWQAAKRADGGGVPPRVRTRNHSGGETPPPSRPAVAGRSSSPAARGRRAPLMKMRELERRERASGARPSGTTSRMGLLPEPRAKPKPNVADYSDEHVRRLGGDQAAAAGALPAADLHSSEVLDRPTSGEIAASARPGRHAGGEPGRRRGGAARTVGLAEAAAAGRPRPRRTRRAGPGWRGGGQARRPRPARPRDRQGLGLREGVAAYGPDAGFFAEDAWIYVEALERR